MKKTIIVLMTLAAMTINTKAQSQITIVDQPALGVNNNYPGFRSPLNGGYLIKLPVGVLACSSHKFGNKSLRR